MDVLKVVSLSLNQSVARFSNLMGLIAINREYISLSVLLSETPNSGGILKPPQAPTLTTALSEVMLCTQTTLLEVRQAAAPVLDGEY